VTEQPQGVNVQAMWAANVAADPLLGKKTGPQPSYTATGENPVTDQAQQPVQGQPSKWRSALGHLHRDMDLMGAALDHGWPIIRRLLSSPRLERGVEAWLRAENAGVVAEIFEGIIDQLEGAASRKEAQNAADAAQAKLTGTGGMTALNAADQSGQYPQQAPDGTQQPQQ